MYADLIHKMVCAILLGCIYAGIITNPDQLRGEVDLTEYKHMCGAVQAENGNLTGITEEEYANDMRRCLLTASVIENRKNSSGWKGSTTEEVIMAKEGKYWQYASTTRNRFKTIEVDDRVKVCVKYVLLYGVICPENVMYQGQGYNGSGVYDSIPVRGDKDEIFCFE